MFLVLSDHAPPGALVVYVMHLNSLFIPLPPLNLYLLVSFLCANVALCFLIRTCEQVPCGELVHA